MIGGALSPSFQYLIMGTIGATFYVIGIGLLYLVTGTLNMADLAVRLVRLGRKFTRHRRRARLRDRGISLKLALFPLHVWLPNAYAYAPSWVTAFLSATATKVAIYLLMRFYFSIFGVAIDFHALPISDVIVVLSLAAMLRLPRSSRCSRTTSSGCWPIRPSPRSVTSRSASGSPTRPR